MCTVTHVSPCKLLLSTIDVSEVTNGVRGARNNVSNLQFSSITKAEFDIETVLLRISSFRMYTKLNYFELTFPARMLSCKACVLE